MTPIDWLRNTIGSALTALQGQVRRIARQKPELLARHLPMLPAPVPIPIRTRRPSMPADDRRHRFR